MLGLLLGKIWPLFPVFHQFLEQSKYKVINKDQWCNVLEFSRTINLDLSNYDEDGAWPVLLDEFVEWYKDKQMSQDFMHSSERVTVTTVMSPISHKLLFVSKRMLLFLHCLPFAGMFWCLLLNGPALLAVQHCSLGRLLCSLYLHYRLVNLPTSSL